MKKEEYLKYIADISPKVRVEKTFIRSFVAGGIISLIGEIFRLLFLGFFEKEQDASAIVSMILITMAAILTGFGVFHKIARWAGAGTFVPITGFSNSVISPALEFKTEGFILGVAAKMFVIAGPVIVYGTISSIFCGFCFYIVTLFGGKL